MVTVKILEFLTIIQFLYSFFPSILTLATISTEKSVIPKKMDQSVVPNVDGFTSTVTTNSELSHTPPASVSDDGLLSLPELIEKYGYPIESHKIISSDGYVLTMHRIPHGRRHSSAKFKPVVFFQHGLLGSAADWFMLGREKALGYLSADAGYDVWLGNARGTRYSRSHNTLTTDDPEYWDFSWHEIALFDVSAMIDYALNHTKQKDLYYVGHSQGTTVFYVLCSEKPEYNSKIKKHFSLSPVVYMDHVTSPFVQFFSHGEYGLGTIGSLIGINEFAPTNKFIAALAAQSVCRDKSATHVLCTNILFLIAGFNEKQMNASLLPIIMGHAPAGASTMQMRHYGQGIISGKFQQYDRGYFENIKKYGTSEPPYYKLENVIAPVYMYYSRNDWLSHEIDVNRLHTRLRNPIEKNLIADVEFNHLDYIYAKDADKLVYKLILTELKKLN